ncbi:MAG: SOS response-associated peptidase, partial [Gammaproteobacteria bacterium]
VLDVVIPKDRFPPRYNIAPSATLTTVCYKVGFEVADMHWGIVPHWARPGQFERPLINARAETIHEKPSFRKLIAHTRVIVPVNGFYEWRRAEGSKATFYFRSTSQEALALAGIYQIDRDGVMQCCLITTDANDVMQPVHNRMPALIPQQAMQDWLCSEDTHVIDALMKPAANDSIKAVEVSNYVNNAHNEGEKCIRPL